MKKLEEPLITTRKYSNECLTCGRDLANKKKSASKLPAQFKVMET